MRLGCSTIDSRYPSPIGKFVIRELSFSGCAGIWGKLLALYLLREIDDQTPRAVVMRIILRSLKWIHNCGANIWYQICINRYIGYICISNHRLGIVTICHTRACALRSLYRKTVDRRVHRPQWISECADNKLWRYDSGICMTRPWLRYRVL